MQEEKPHMIVRANNEPENNASLPMFQLGCLHSFAQIWDTAMSEEKHPDKHETFGCISCMT